MAALHSTMVNSRGNTVSTTNSKEVEVMAETWEVRITTRLQKDGTYTVVISDRIADRPLHVYRGQYPEPRKEEAQK